MLKIGLTGGIGVGKSVCGHVFETIGVPIYNSDIEAKRLMVEDKKVVDAILELFGKESYIKKGVLNRKHLASIIFSDKNKLAKINAIVHPAVYNDFAKWCVVNNQNDYVIQENALLYETGSYSHFDKVILVHADKEVRIRRVMTRDGVSRDDILARIKNQLPQEIKLESADYVILNDGGHSIVKQIMYIHQCLLQS